MSEKKGEKIMARFYAEIQGNRGMVSRMGTETSGMWVHVRGWNRGGKAMDIAHIVFDSGFWEVWHNGQLISCFCDRKSAEEFCFDQNWRFWRN